MTKKTILLKIVKIQKTSYNFSNFYTGDCKFRDIIIYFLYLISNLVLG